MDVGEGCVYALRPAVAQLADWGLSVREAEEDILIPFCEIFALIRAVESFAVGGGAWAVTFAIRYKSVATEMWRNLIVESKKRKRLGAEKMHPKGK